MKHENQPVPPIPNSTAASLGFLTLVMAAIHADIAYKFLPRSQTSFVALLIGAYIFGSGTLFATFRNRGWWRKPWRFWTLQFNFLTSFIAMVANAALHSLWPK